MLHLEVTLPDTPPDFRLSKREFAAADTQAAAGALRGARGVARRVYRRQAPELAARAVNARVRTYRRRLWIGLQPVNITHLRTTQVTPPPTPGPGGYGADGLPGVFLWPRRRTRTRAWRRYMPYRRGQGRRPGVSIVPVLSEVPPHGGEGQLTAPMTSCWRSIRWNWTGR